jgi:heptaprenyl diphosphate synthase
MTGSRRATHRLVLLSMITACGLVLFIFESFLPLLPWFRPGLGNIATILALLLFGFGDALKVTVLRIVLGALILGRLFTPVFVFALCGGLASALVMAAAHHYGKRIFGPVGISVLGAAVHNMVQLLVAYLLFVKSIEIFIFTPVFLAAGIATGTLTGFVAAMVMEKAVKGLMVKEY